MSVNYEAAASKLEKPLGEPTDLKLSPLLSPHSVTPSIPLSSSLAHLEIRENSQNNLTL